MKDNTKESPCKECFPNRLPKANELPLYRETVDVTENVVHHPTELEIRISKINKYLSQYLSTMSVSWNQFSNFYNTGVAHTKNSYNYITEEENFMPRLATIASGGLLGYLLAFKGRKLKKLSYSTLGVGLISAICYPKEIKNLAGNIPSLPILGDIFTKVGKQDEKNLGEKMDSTSSQSTGFSSIQSIFDGISATLKDWSKKIGLSKKAEIPKPEGDIGQNNPEDKGLYSTRS